jgi:hypothetical protein
MTVLTSGLLDTAIKTKQMWGHAERDYIRRRGRK